MLRKNMDDFGAFPLANFIGLILGFVSLSAFFVMQSLTVLLPLLFAPMVCATLCYLLYASHKSVTEAESDVAVNPVRVDLLYAKLIEFSLVTISALVKITSWHLVGEAAEKLPH